MAKRKRKDPEPCPCGSPTHYAEIVKTRVCSQTGQLPENCNQVS